MDGKPLLHFRDILKIIFCLHFILSGKGIRGYIYSRQSRAVAVAVVSFSKPKFNLNLNFVMVRWMIFRVVWIWRTWIFLFIVWWIYYLYLVGISGEWNCVFFSLWHGVDDHFSFIQNVIEAIGMGSINCIIYLNVPSEILEFYLEFRIYAFFRRREAMVSKIWCKTPSLLHLLQIPILECVFWLLTKKILKIYSLFLFNCD